MTDEQLIELEKMLRQCLHWRDFLADELQRIERHISDDSRAYGNALGLTVKPSLPQLRRLLDDAAKRRAAA